MCFLNINFLSLLYNIEILVCAWFYTSDKFFAEIFTQLDGNTHPCLLEKNTGSAGLLRFSCALSFIQVNALKWLLGVCLSWNKCRGKVCLSPVGVNENALCCKDKVHCCRNPCKKKWYVFYVKCFCVSVFRFWCRKTNWKGAWAVWQIKMRTYWKQSHQLLATNLLQMYG